MLLNTNTDVPDSFYIFVDTDNPLTSQALRTTKTFSSSAFSMSKYNRYFKEKYLRGRVKYLPYKQSSDDLDIFSPFYRSVVNDFSVEFDAERVREKFFPLYPSRMSAVYAFGDYDTCVKVSEKHNWDLDTVRRFKLIDDKLNRIIRVNMDIVSQARTMYVNSILDDLGKEELWKNYWRGLNRVPINSYLANFSFGNIIVEDIYEYLIEGSVILVE